MNAPASHDLANTPKVAAAHFTSDTRFMWFGEFPTGRLLTLQLPKDMTRRRVYAALVPFNMFQFMTWPAFVGELVFRLAGNIVLRVPFCRQETGRVSIRPGAEARSASVGFITELGFQPAPPDALLVCLDPSYYYEPVIPPLRLTLACDSVELNVSALATSEANVAAVLACHSEGFSE